MAAVASAAGAAVAAVALLVPSGSLAAGGWPAPAAPRLEPAAAALGWEGGLTLQDQVHRRPSLYCFVAVMPRSYEVDLMRVILAEGAGPFACDEGVVFSNETISLGIDTATGTEVYTATFEGSLQVEYGGRWGTALNTEVFIRIWNAVAEAGRYEYYDWTVKLDADCVFLPQRLLQILNTVSVDVPAYLNNCKYGLHGPIEVLNRLALETFLSKEQDCEDIRESAMTLQPLHWNPKIMRYVGTTTGVSFGEDEYLRRCLDKLQIPGIDEFALLTEDACGVMAYPCNSGAAAFHPFKATDSYLGCLHFAEGQDKANAVSSGSVAETSGDPAVASSTTAVATLVDQTSDAALLPEASRSSIAAGDGALAAGDGSTTPATQAGSRAATAWAAPSTPGNSAAAAVAGGNSAPGHAAALSAFTVAPVQPRILMIVDFVQQLGQRLAHHLR